VEELETERAANLLVMHLLREEWKNNLARRRFEAEPGALLMVAGLLAVVKTDTADGRSLAWRVGANSTKGNTDATMSEMRFRRLLQAKSLDEFFLLARRAVQLADSSVDIAVLADDLLAWAYEQGSSAGVQKPTKSLRFRWAQDYYQPLKDRDAAWIAPEETHEGEMA
jgi:CRISPR system Cascade subunit CasB